jgi:hypothetical protein
VIAGRQVPRGAACTTRAVPVRGWAVLVLGMLLTLLWSLQALAQPQASKAASGATAAASVWDTSRKPISGWGTQESPASAATPDPKPTPTGLERLSDEWPDWVKVAFQYRGRVESTRPIISNAAYDPYYLNRLRLAATFGVRPWLQASVQIQDSQVMAYDLGPAGKSVANALDVRQAYVAFGTLTGGPLAVRVGRQELTMGEGRLIGSPDWGNTNRTFDILRTTTVRPGMKLDVVVGGPVDIQLGSFDRWKSGESFAAAYASFDKVIAGVIEPFVLVRRNTSAVSETLRVGDAMLYTAGGRVTYRLKPGVDLAGDIVVQRGDVAGDPVAAWASHLAFARTMAETPWKPKLTIEYNFASGDRASKDGTRQTFDQLYASNHARYGLADAVGWRNMHHLGVTVEMVPITPLKVTLGAQRYFLASPGDGVYTAGGVRWAFVKNATSRDIGWEADVVVTYTVSKELSFGAGLGTIFAGEYLSQAGARPTFYSPYVTWSTKF